MDDTNQRFKAQIGNKNYTFVGKSSTDHMRTVTRLMNDRLSQLKELSPNITDEDSAILLAFNAFSEQLKLQEKLNLELDKESNKNKERISKDNDI